MLHLKKRGFALINTIVIISLIVTLSSMLYKIMINNAELASLYGVDYDCYYLNSEEEEIIYGFMVLLNRKSEAGVSENKDIDSEKNENKEKDSKDILTNIFGSDFVKSIDEDILEYNSDSDKLTLKIKGEYDSMRVRELRHIVEDNKIILIPTMNFKNGNIYNE